MFESIATLVVATSMRELYRLVLIDTPLAPYFSMNFTSEDLDEMNVEIMRNTLYKAYLDDFAQLCHGIGGATSDVMGDMLAFEVRDRQELCAENAAWLQAKSTHSPPNWLQLPMACLDVSAN